MGQDGPLHYFQVHLAALATRPTSPVNRLVEGLSVEPRSVARESPLRGLLR
jgi:hypothetical protein